MTPRSTRTVLTSIAAAGLVPLESLAADFIEGAAQAERYHAERRMAVQVAFDDQDAPGRIDALARDLGYPPDLTIEFFAEFGMAGQSFDALVDQLTELAEAATAHGRNPGHAPRQIWDAMHREAEHDHAKALAALDAESVEAYEADRRKRERKSKAASKFRRLSRW